MSFPVDDIMLLPETYGNVRNIWGGLHSLDGIIWHDTEGGGWSRDHAVATRNWQVYNPGSYTWIIYDKNSPGAKGGALLTVPYLEANGGVNPGTEFWHPERFPFLKEKLDKPCPVPGCGGAYRNPTMHHAQIAFSGKRIAIDRNEMPSNMVDTARGLRDFLNEKAGKELVQSKHAHWQTNRSDPGTVFAALEIKTLPDTSMEDDMPPILRPVTGQVARIKSNTPARVLPQFHAEEPVDLVVGDFVQPFAVFQGAGYKTADGIRTEWLGFVSGKQVLYVPLVYAALEDLVAGTAIRDYLRKAKRNITLAEAALPQT